MKVTQNAPSTCSEPGGKQWQHRIWGWRNLALGKIDWLVAWLIYWLIDWLEIKPHPDYFHNELNSYVTVWRNYMNPGYFTLAAIDLKP